MPVNSPVPVAVIAPVVRRLLYPQGMARDLADGRGREDEDRVAILARRVGLDRETIYRMITTPKYASVEFDVADKILAGLNSTHLWWTELADLYYSLRLMERCGHKDCHVYFYPTLHEGRRRQRYCSRACANSAKRGHRRVKYQKLKPIKGYRTEVCRNGHKRTPESTITLKSGRIRCRICNNENAKRSYYKGRVESDG